MLSVYATIQYLIFPCILWSASYAQDLDCFTFTIPKDPENLRIGNIVSNAVILHWALPFVDVPPTENFEITVSPAPQHGSCTGLCIIQNNRTTCEDGDNCRMTIDSLQPGITYSFSLRSLNCRGGSRSIGPVQATVNGEITTTSTTKDSLHSSVAHSVKVISTRIVFLPTSTVTASIPNPVDQDLHLRIQWTITGVLVPISIISTALLCALFFWLLVRRHTRRQQQSPLEAQNSTQSSSSFQTCDKQSEVDDAKVTDDHESNTRMSEHVYSVPRWSRNSDMLYNEAYQSNFTISINAAYSSSNAL